MRKVAFAFVGGLTLILAATVTQTARQDTPGAKNWMLDRVLRSFVESVGIEDAWAQVSERDSAIPAVIHQRVDKIAEAVGLQLIKEPGEFTGPSFVARVKFEPQRPGYKACPDHYPPRFVTSDASCPKLHNDDPPAPGWTICHGAFYAHEKIGCPPKPEAPTAPVTTPRPRCDFGPEICKQEAPGGPVLFRTLQTSAVTAADPRVLSDVRTRTTARPEVGRAPADSPVQPAGRRVTMERAAAAEVGVESAARRVEMERVQISEAALASMRGRLQLRDYLKMQPNLLCRGGKCQWGGDGVPITLPAPPVTPIRHVPCEYQHVSFFVPENRYCPKEGLGERPAAGISLYVSWTGDDPSSPELYYHRDDFDGVIRHLMQILGGSDDRYALSEATEREKAAARATAMLIKTEYVTPIDADTIQLADDPSWLPLCSSERFSGLPQPGRCSGVKVGNRMVATSAHCVRNQRQCSETSVVFGYYGGSASSAARTVASRNVYRCESVVASRRPATIGERGADWTIFEVDRVIDAPTAALAKSTDVRPSLVTTVIGHPMGLPAIVTRLGVVQTTTSEYFIANSDTFVGNSGSAVFAAQSVEDNAPRVLGLLTGGGYDFEDSVENGKECVQAKWCNGPECLGDDVVYTDGLITALSAHTPES